MASRTAASTIRSLIRLSSRWRTMLILSCVLHSIFPGATDLAWAASTRDRNFARDVSAYFERLSMDGELAAHPQAILWSALKIWRFAADSRFPCVICKNRLPLYRQWFEEAAVQSSQDWRLLAAIGYQESKMESERRHPRRVPKD